MKKIILIGMLVVPIFLLSSTALSAKDNWKPASKNYLTITCLINPAGLGIKHHIFDNVYAAGSLQYQSSVSDLEFQTGAVYLIPRKVIIFTFYGGAGLQFSRNEGYQYPYVAVGTNFLFFFSEIIHPLKSEMSPEYRFGLSFKF